MANHTIFVFTRDSPSQKKAFLGGQAFEAKQECSGAKSAQRLSKRSTVLRSQGYLTASVAIINIAVLIWAITARHLDKRGVGTLHTGNCHRVGLVNSVVHLLLNAISSLFLAAGNYCMQVLAAPSRADVHLAHATGDWLEIGVPSFGNIRKLRRSRVVHWVALGLVSVLLHTLYVWNTPQ
jgi:hypothetical protein